MTGDVTALVVRLRRMNFAACDDAATALEEQAEEIARLELEDELEGDIEASRTELCADLRRATEYGKETSRFAQEWLSRAEAAERERDALKLNVRQLEEFIGRREDDILFIARERDALKAENERLRAAALLYFKLRADWDHMVRYGRDPGEDAEATLDAARAELDAALNHEGERG